MLKVARERDALVAEQILFEAAQVAIHWVLKSLQIWSSTLRGMVTARRVGSTRVQKPDQGPSSIPPKPRIGGVLLGDMQCVPSAQRPFCARRTAPRAFGGRPDWGLQ